MLHLTVSNVNCPRMAPALPHRHARRREARIGEHAERNGEVARNSAQFPVHRRAAAWTELKGRTVAAFDRAGVCSSRTGDGALVALEPRLHTKRRAGTALAGEAVAHRYSCRLAVARDTHIPAAAGRYSLAHL